MPVSRGRTLTMRRKQSTKTGFGHFSSSVSTTVCADVTRHVSTVCPPHPLGQHRVSSTPVRSAPCVLHTVLAPPRRQHHHPLAWTPSYLRLIDSCITQLEAQGQSRTCNESKDREEKDTLISGPPAASPASFAGVQGCFAHKKQHGYSGAPPASFTGVMRSYMKGDLN